MIDKWVWRNGGTILTGKPLCLPQIPYGLAWHWVRASTVRDCRLTDRWVTSSSYRLETQRALFCIKKTARRADCINMLTNDETSAERNSSAAVPLLLSLEAKLVNTNTEYSNAQYSTFPYLMIYSLSSIHRKRRDIQSIPLKTSIFDIDNRARWSTPSLASARTSQSTLYQLLRLFLAKDHNLKQVFV